MDSDREPATWPVVPLRKVVNVERKQHSGLLPYVGLEHIASNGVGKFTGDFRPSKVKSNTFSFDERHVLYGRLRAYLNKVLCPDFAGHCSTEIFPLLPSEALNRRFLSYWLTWEETCNRIAATATGARMPRANMDEVLAFGIPLPSLDEQKRIVAVLDQAFAALDRARTNAEASFADAQGLLSSIIEHALRMSGGASFTLQQLMDSGAVVSHLDGNHGSDYPRKEEFVSSGVPYISANCIVDQEIDLDRAKFLSPGRAARIRKGIAHDGDVIFAHNATVGPVALLRTTHEIVVLGTSVTYYRCEPSKLLPEFLLYEMRGSSFKAQYEAVMRQATRSQVPITMQRTFTHTIPSIAEQEEVVKRCSEAEQATRALTSSYSERLADIGILRQSLLQAAFSGQLT